ncbi:MAG: DUF2141 domain-containing protein [Pseudomonadota bacterium]|nr:DUF2141 domain-containing protein [Pseudomonadota bacterium]
MSLDKFLFVWGICLSVLGIEAVSGELVLTVTNIDRPGTLFVTVYQGRGAFVEDMANTRKPVERAGVHSVTRQNTTTRMTRLVITVPDGIVAIAVFHDVNGNGVIDEGFLGIPKEQYGFGNDARPLLRPPSFRASSIVIEDQTSHSIRLRR